MRQTDKLQDHIVDDSGHNFDEAVINMINDLAHVPEALENADELNRQNAEQIELFFELTDDL